MKSLLFLTVILMLIALNPVQPGTSLATVKQITSSIDAVKTITDKVREHIDRLKSVGKAISPLLSNIGKLAPFLGVAGAFVSVALSFIPGQESAELKEMRR